MVEKKRSSYTPEFRKKATDLALTSGHPTSYVAQLLKIKESTLGNWVARAKRIDNSTKGVALRNTQKPASSKKTPIAITGKTQSPEDSGKNRKNSSQPHQKTGMAATQTVMGLSEGNANNHGASSEPGELLPGISESLPLELERLRSENKRLKRERNIFREAIILLASQDANACS